MRIAYLVNQYPKVSHSFIRREIAALEVCGLSVARFCVRSCASQLVDAADKEELLKTQIILGVGVKGLLWHLLRVAVTHPVGWLRAVWMAVKLGWGTKRGILRHLAYVAEACVLLAWFAQQEITHVHAHFGTNSTTVAMLCHVMGGPRYSFTVHGPEEFDRAESLGLTEKINRAAFVVAISSFGRSQLYRWCDRNQWEKIHVIRCGLERDFWQLPPTPIPEEPNFVCVGRLCEQKGQLLLLQAMQQLISQGVECKLTLVGDGPLRSQIQALIKLYNLEAHVKITGWATAAEVQKHLLNSRVMVLPSFAEGLPVVVMEALALGRPVISTYVAGIPELIQPGINGWLVPPGCMEALTTAMGTALKLPTSQLEQMGKAGATAVMRQHDIAQEASKLAQLFWSTKV